MFNPPNNVFRNAYKDLYIARKKDVQYDDFNNEIVIYDKPYYFGKVNYQPINPKNLQMYISEFGETQNNLVQCLIDYNEKDFMKEFDVAYLYGNTPKGEEVYGENANFEIKVFRPQNAKILVILEEMIKEK